MMKRVAVYARVSTDHEDQKNSVENQEMYFMDYIEKQEGWELYKMYADEGISGTSLKKRDKFNKMMADAKLKKFDIILTKEVCRFARNTLDTIEKTRELKNLGIEVRFLIDNISTFDTDGELRLTIMAGIAQDESRRTSERVQFGVIQQMKKGVAFGNIMYGYEFKNGKLIVNKKEAEMIRKIFHWYLDNGYGGHKICSKLKEEKYEIKRPKNPKNKYNWGVGTIFGILKNVKYRGDLKQRITYTNDYLEHKSKKNNGEVEFIYIKDHHEPIIDRELFEKVQIELARRSNLNKKEKTNYSNAHGLSGKIICGQCGYGYIRSYGKERVDGSKRQCWKCKMKAHHGEEKTINGYKVGCNSDRVSDSSITDSISQSLKLMNRDKEIIYNNLKNNIENYFDNLLNVNYNMKEIEKKEKEYKEKIDKIVELYINGVIDKNTFDKKEKEINKELTNAEEIRKNNLLKKQILEDRQIITKTALKVFYELLEYKKINDDVCRKIIDKIVIQDKHNIDIYFKGYSNLFYINNVESNVSGKH